MELMNETHLVQINDALAKLAEATRHAKMASMAGIDMTAQQQQIAQAESKLRQIKQVYFPGR